MEFIKKLKIRFYTALTFILIGVLLVLTGRLRNIDMASSFGIVFIVIGIARIAQYKRITRDEESLRKRETAETDERNVMLWTKARGLAFSVCIMLAAAAVVILYLLGMELIAQTIAYTLLSFMLIYWICYLIVSCKY